jgi:Alpha/beta hydrolase of unknown function (DUF900)
MWFLNCRSEPVGGDVCPVKVTDGTLTYLTYPDLLNDIRGRHILIGVHGFNVHQAGAVDHFQEWNTLLELGSSAIFIGALWPGDSAWLGALEYGFAARSAMQSGDSLADFINRNMGSALSVSFVSHSLGARVALNTIQGLLPSLTIRRVVLMAAAVDDDCLTQEFAPAAKKVIDISLLTSDRDDVLKLAFPLGNPLSGIFAQGHPYWHAALGRDGPAALPVPNNLHAGWQLPDSWNVGHGDYLPPSAPFPEGYNPAPYIVPLDIPSPTAPAPAPDTPEVFNVGNTWENWQSAWTAALTSSRFR